MITLMQDVRFAMRQLRKTPGFTLTVLLTLALGIGANAAIFTLVNAVLLRQLPAADPATLIRLGDHNDCCVGTGTPDNGDFSYFPTATYELLRKSVPEFQDLAAMESGFSYRPQTVRRDGTGEQARSVMAEYVSGNYFRTFGLAPQSGRLLVDADDVRGAPVAAVMSYDTWQHQYAGDAKVVGGTFFVNTKPVTVVGIAPRGFFGDRVTSSPPEFYLPIHSMDLLANTPYVYDPQVNWLYMIGRVKPGTDLGQLQVKVSTVVRQAFSANKNFSTEDGKKELARVHVVLTPGGGGITQLQENYRSHLQLLMWIAALVLLVACANIANLLLVRGMSRRAEMSIRSALGAMRSRILRQLLTESILLAGLGGVAGMVVAYAGARMLLALAFPDAAQSMPIHASPSPMVIGFAFGLSLLTGVLFGVAPAWMAAQAKPAEALRSNSRTTAQSASLLQRGLVVVQAALSLVLLVGAGLFSQSLNKLETTDLRLNSTNRYIVHINPQAAGYTTTMLEPLYRTIEQRFHEIPGVVHVGLSNYTPMEDNNWSNGIRVQGQPNVTLNVSWIKASAEYLDSVGTRVVMGRGIGVQDVPSSTPVAVVNQTFVKDFFKDGRNPIGAHIGYPDSPGDYEIVGVVEDTVYTAVQWKDHRMYFVPILQRPPSNKEPIEGDSSLYAGAMVIETSHPMSDMEALTRRTLSSINPNMTVVKFQTFDQQIADRFTEERMIARLTMLFGGLALMLATIGLYGVTSYSVVRRTAEIGIRMALGAERSSVIAMVMRGAAIQAGIGLAIGIPVAYPCVRFVKTELYEITSVNPMVMAAAVLTLAAAASVAGLLPARRAASINPVQALRVE